MDLNTQDRKKMLIGIEMLERCLRLAELELQSKMGALNVLVRMKATEKKSG